MKYQKILGLVATAGLLLAGCATDSDNSNTWLSDPNAVHVSASVGSIFTRSNPAASDEDGQKGFNSGDMMGVSNSGKSLTYTYNESTNDWQPGNGSYLVWDASNLKFQCWYPADGKNTFSKGYIQEDQSNETEIAKSDYMTAEVTNLTEIPGNRQLKVELVRKTARLILNIQSFNDQFTADTKVDHVRIVGKECTDASETTINIMPLQNGEGGKGTTYTALVAPGTTEGHLYFAAEGTTETPLVVKTGALEAGKSYTYNLTVGKNTITVNDVTVADWNTGNTLKGTTDVKDKTPYVTFTAPAEQTFKMVCYGGYKISNLEYSVNFGDWKAVKDGEGVTFGGKNGGLRLRGKNVKGTADSNDTRIFSTITFIFDKDKEKNVNTNVMVACTGDIRTLLDYDHYETVSTSEARFVNLFNNCQALTSAPKLPATDIAKDCYNGMFYYCRYLKNAPELPATTLADQCYQNMFYACVSLTSAPKLQATKLAFNCYANMFSYCYWLKEAPELPATTLASQCYQDMFTNCYFKKAPKLPAEIMKSNCYAGMFAGCINLTEAPELPAEQLESFCYSRMFDGCTKLSTVTMLAPSDKISKASNCCYNWLDNAGTDASSRTLKVTDAAAYIALENTNDLPAIWKKGGEGTTVLNKDNGKIE